jgi:hypothetical protein
MLRGAVAIGRYAQLMRPISSSRFHSLSKSCLGATRKRPLCIFHSKETLSVMTYAYLPIFLNHQLLNGIDHLISQPSHVYTRVGLPDNLLFNQLLHGFTASRSISTSPTSPQCPRRDIISQYPYFPSGVIDRLKASSTPHSSTPVC